ncbi:UNVERIFIED_CONTAM: hypothetical protein GTU68_028965, partial [Idotea baltica]|nr:hypothetical protein [Idotea baltica]
FEQSEVDLPLGSNAEQEEEKKLQVLLKECEGIDLGGRSFNRPPSPMKQFSSSLPSSASEDFIDEINEWIHSDSMKNLKTSSKMRSAGSDDVKPKFNCEAPSASSEEKKVSVDEMNLQPSPILKTSTLNTNDVIKTSTLNANDVIKADIKKTSDAGSVPHKKDSSKVMKCKVCSKAFKLRNRHDLYIHEARHGIPTLPCKICSKVFKLKKDLSAHMKSHDKEHRFKCDICEKRLCSRRNLQMHVAKIHENKKPYKCELCAKVYGKQASLKVHIRSVHTREKPYKCTYCPKAFASSDLLAIHKSIHSNNLKYICSICQKGFRSFANLFSHKKIHLKEKVFSCSVCKLEFKCHLSLLKHKITHKRLSRPLKCRHCDHTFDLKESYEMHMLSIHKEKVKIAEINIKMNAPNVLHKSIRSFQLPTLNLSSKSANVQSSGLESSAANGKPVRVIHWPPKLIQKAARLNPEAASVSPNLKLKLIEPTSMDKNLNSETALSECLKTDSSNGTSGSLFLNLDHIQCPPASSNYNKDSDNFLQISDISLSSFPSSSTSSKDNCKLWPPDPKPNREIRSFNLLSSERHPLKFLPTADYKLADHINNFPYHMPDTNSSYESNNCDKGESNFLDTFASKCSAEDDNMEKFLFEDISSFVE